MQHDVSESITNPFFSPTSVLCSAYRGNGNEIVAPPPTRRESPLRPSETFSVTSLSLGQTLVRKLRGGELVFPTSYRDRLAGPVLRHNVCQEHTRPAQQIATFKTKFTAVMPILELNQRQPSCWRPRNRSRSCRATSPSGECVDSRIGIAREMRMIVSFGAPSAARPNAAHERPEAQKGQRASPEAIGQGSRFSLAPDRKWDE
jgi:hypothetical protein